MLLGNILSKNLIGRPNLRVTFDDPDILDYSTGSLLWLRPRVTNAGRKPARNVIFRLTRLASLSGAEKEWSFDTPSAQLSTGRFGEKNRIDIEPGDSQPFFLMSLDRKDDGRKQLFIPFVGTSDMPPDLAGFVVRSVVTADNAIPTSLVMQISYDWRDHSLKVAI